MTDHPVTVQGPIAAGDTITVTVAAASPPPPPPPPPPPIVIPFQGFAKTEAVLDPGTVVRVPAGVYKERPVLTQAGTQWVGDPGAKLDFSAMAVPLQQGGLTINGPDIVVKGVELFGSAGAGVQVNGPRVQLVDVKSTKHRQEAYAWRKTADHGLIKGGEIAFVNEKAENLSGGEQGVGKTISVGLTLDGVWIHDIGMDPSHPAENPGGEGPWWDSVGLISADGTVKNCRIERCWATGPFYEISLRGRMFHNVIADCGMASWGAGTWGSGILASASCDMDIYENVFFRNQSHFRMLAWSRTDAPKNADGSQRLSDHILFHDNVLIEPTLHQFSFDAGVTNHATILAYIASIASGNQAFRNRFFGKLAVKWNGSVLTTLAAINALPGGGGSTLLTQAERDQIVAAIPNGVQATLTAAGIAA